MTKTTLITALTLLTILTSCSKGPKCWGDDKNKGDIEDNFEMPDCYGADISTDHNYVIRSSDDLDTLDNCTRDPFPVDFTQHSIIGQVVSGQCNIKVIRDLTIDDNNKEYVYTVTVKECGLCKKEGIDDQLVLVPAIPNDYTIRFDVKHK